MKSKQNAYTLVEVLMSMALISLLVGLSLPVFGGFIDKNQLDASAQLTIRALRTAQVNSQTNKEASTWGVSFQTNTLVLFKGATYASRDSAFDQEYDLAESSISGASEIVFSQLSGLPTSTPTITITSGSDNKSITVNAKGSLIY